MFQEYQVAPEEDEQKKIRKIFIRLSNKLHPDKAKDDKQAELYHGIMQQINEAYQRNDVNTLLEMEVKYLNQSAVEAAASIEVITDILEQQIEQLERDIFLVNGQIDRTSTEIHNLRYSQLGILLTQLERAEAAGMGVEEELADMERTAAEMEEFRDLLKESIDMGRISPKTQDWLTQNQTGPQMTIGEVNEQFAEMFGSDTNPNEIMQEFFGTMTDFFDEDEEFENPTFPIGSTVKVAKKVMRNKINVKGWQGRVTDVYEDFKGNEVCEIALDSISMNSLPLGKVADFIIEGIPFGEIDISAKKLVAAEPRDTYEERTKAFKTLFHRFNWQFATEDPKQQRRLYDILMKRPGLEDRYNWDLHFSSQVQFPFKAELRDKHLGRGKVDVLEIFNFDEEDGHIVKIQQKEKDREGYFPLNYLKTKGKYKELLDDYYLWVEECIIYG